MGATWDYVGTALQKYHAIGTLAEHDRDGDTLSVRLQVPTCRAATADRVALSAGDSAPWLFDHLAVDRIIFDLEAVTDAGDDPARVTFTVRREWFGDPDVEPTDQILDSMDRERSPKR